MVGRELTESYPPRKDCIDKNDVVLELKNLTGNGDKNISLKLHRRDSRSWRTGRAGRT